MHSLVPRPSTTPVLIVYSMQNTVSDGVIEGLGMRLFIQL